MKNPSTSLEFVIRNGDEILIHRQILFPYPIEAELLDGCIGEILVWYNKIKEQQGYDNLGNSKN